MTIVEVIANVKNAKNIFHFNIYEIQASKSIGKTYEMLYPCLLQKVH
jgi:hypothetical protein